MHCHALLCSYSMCCMCAQMSASAGRTEITKSSSAASSPLFSLVVPPPGATTPTVPALSHCSHGNASKTAGRQTENSGGEREREVEILCYCTVALLIVPVALLTKPCHMSLSFPVRGEHQSRTQSKMLRFTMPESPYSACTHLSVSGYSYTYFSGLKVSPPC